MRIPATLPELRAAFQAGEHDRVLAAFGELDFLEAACRASVAALIAEIAHVVREAPLPLPAAARFEHPSGARLDAEVLALLGAILEANREALSREPERLFALLYREVYWRDLRCWAEHLRATFEARTDACWLRPLRPPETMTLVSWRIPGEPRALAGDGRMLLLSREVRGYESGKPWRLPMPSGPAPGAARFVACAEGTARLFAIDVAEPLHVLGRRDSARERATFLASGRHVLTASRTEVDVSSVEDGSLLGSFTSPVAVQAIPFDDGPVLLHSETSQALWLFDRALPLATPLAALAPSLSLTEGERSIAYRLNERAYAAERCLLDPRTGHALLTIVGARTPPGVSVSPDGSCVAIFAEKSIQLWSTATLSPYATLTAHGRTVQRAVFSPDSRTVFTEAFTEVRASRVADGACLASRTIDCQSYVGGVLPGPEGSVLVHDGKRWLLWQYLEDRLLPIGDADYVTAEWSAVSPSGDRLIAAEGTGAFSCWSLPEGELRFRERLPERVAALAFHPSGTFFTGGQTFYDASTGRARARLPATLVSKGTWPAFDAAGRFLVTRHDVPEAAQLWDVRDLAAPALLGRFPIGRHTRGHPRARFSEGLLVFGDWNETVVVDLALLPTARARDEAPPVHYEWRTRFSTEGTTVVFDHESGLSFWDVPQGALRRFVAADRSLGFFAGGSRVLVRRGDELCALDAHDGAEVWRLMQRGESSEEVHAADEEGVLLYNERTTSGVVLALDVRDGSIRYRLSGLMLRLHHRDVFLTRSAEGEVALRDVATGAVRLTLAGLEGGFFAISPDHRWLAAHEHRTELWDLTTGTRAHVLDSTAYSFRFREDSAALIATSSQSPQSGNTDTITEEIFDVATGASIGGSSWDEYGFGDTSPPQEIAPGIVKDGCMLRVGDRALPLPASAVVCRTAAGETFVAGLSPGKRVELYVLSRNG